MGALSRGSLVSDRFAIEELAASGGMASVYRGRDLLSGEWVAVKVQEAADEAALRRFEREARLLAELQHPGIARYVADGLLEGGELFLAMEWIGGESLEKRLAHGKLPIGEAISIAERIAEVLAAIHARGVVHRDLKPANVHLVGAEVKLLDFGIAGLRRPSASITRTGAILGTPGYMAPEQARGGEVDARADLFSLGCVLFECLQGRPPFVGEDGMAVLAKILLEEAPPVEGVPAALAKHVARLLEKDPAARPASAAEVAESLHAIEGELAQLSLPEPAASLTSAEQRMLCVALVDRGAATTDRSTVRLGEGASRASPVPALRAMIESRSGRLEELADGTLVAVWSGSDAEDSARRAARSVLEVRMLLPGSAIALVTGRGVALLRSWAGEAIDRGARLLRRSQGAILLDDLSAALLASQFELGPGPALLREREQPAQRTLLGKPAPFVGRERELAALEGLYAECVAEPISRAVLVIAPPGMGKSRLAAEFLDRLRARPDAPRVWRGRGDAIRSGSPFGILGSALRSALGLQAGADARERAVKVRARVASAVPAADVDRVADFLGELAGVPSGGELLAAAREDRYLLHDQFRRAFVDWLWAECNAGPVVLVLEDLHWGDVPTVKFLNDALRHLAERPLFVLALARPEVHDAFPSLWEGRRVEEIRLSPLTPKASAKLARSALESAPAATIDRIVAQAEGNALHLEELIHAAAEGREGQPQTVLAMLSTRLERLEPEARQVLRAASVFGQRFWNGAIATLLSMEQPRVREWLSMLSEREVIVPTGKSRFPGEEEHAFRHALVRDAAYAMLTEDDRALGHRLACGWLEAHGETEAIVLAEHCDRGGEPARAAAFYLRAAEQALEGDDIDAVLQHAARALALEPEGRTLGRLLLLTAEARGWRGEHAEAAQSAFQALDELQSASSGWYAAIGHAAEAKGKLGDRAGLLELHQKLLDLGDKLDVIAAVRTAAQLYLCGKGAEANALIARVESAPLPADARRLGFRAHGLSVRALFSGDLATYRALKAQAVESFERADDRRNALAQRVKLGYANQRLGAFEEAEAVFREAMAQAERLGLRQVTALAKHNLGLVVALQGRLDEGRRLEEEAIEAFHAQHDDRLEHASRGYLGYILMLAGELEEARREIGTALARTQQRSPVRAHLLASLSEVYLKQGRHADALETAAESMRLLESMGGMDEGEPLVRLIHAQALHANGRIDEAREALRAAESSLRARAASITEPGWRESFLARVPENARTLALALEWGRG